MKGSSTRRVKFPKRQQEQGKRLPVASAQEVIDQLSQSNDSDDQQIKVRVGRIPYHWYDQFKHFGYDNTLTKVERQKQRDKIEEFIQKAENKNWWKTITDQLNNKDIVLTDKQLHLIDRIRSGKFASKTIADKQEHFEFPYDSPFPLHAHPPPKRRFMPSKWESMKVNKILEGILQGRIKLPSDVKEEKQEELEDIWVNSLQNLYSGAVAVAAPRMKLPTHHQSYNPPVEYLFDEKERLEWEEMDEQDRPTNFVPQQFDKLRHIPFYSKLINERFERCLDLYLCPRVKKRRIHMNPQELIPRIPQPSQLRPFPTALNIVYHGHSASVDAMAVSPTGKYLITGDSDGVLIIWEVLSSRKLFEDKLQEPIRWIDWSRGGLILIASGVHVEMFSWKIPKQQALDNDKLIQEASQNNKDWVFYDKDTTKYKQGYRVRLDLKNDVTYVQFHAKGDYFLTVCPLHTTKSDVVIMHQLSKCASQRPFNKSKGLIKKAYFHPRKPHLIIMTNSNVYVFDLKKQEIFKRLRSGADWNSSLSIHPYGDNIVVGSEDKKLLWYDLDMGDKPYKTFEYHERGVTSTDFHPKYPLLASGSNDGSVHILHAKVYTDVLESALILPLKILKGHQIRDGEGVRKIKFHPIQPWVFSCGIDHKVCLWT